MASMAQATPSAVVPRAANDVELDASFDAFAPHDMSVSSIASSDLLDSARGLPSLQISESAPAPSHTQPPAPETIAAATLELGLLRSQLLQWAFVNAAADASFTLQRNSAHV
eukprot:TRINITY_DN1889_c0_g1_i7.p3 TRINITY_DN1889_c0_g1~~TRINITY_DN1889_c0_g1_i7.p3  ORF type:complete len:112 (+),score=24.85 TRINITY_DN1889_c0_g1_i7:954-1289(+)